MKLHNLLLVILTLASITAASYASAGESVIVVYYDKEIGLINEKVFGNTFLSNDPGTDEPKYSHYYGRADYGLGIWDPKKKESVNEVVELAKNAGISIVRFTNGSYPWKKTIGKGREHFLYGIDEFLKTTKELGAEAVILMNYFVDNEQDAADLVEYLNAPCDGEHPWAEKRAENGHPDPYNVKYFEIGNEIYYVNNGVSPEQYAHKYLKFYEAMKAVDSYIKIGINLYTNEWNRRMLQIVKDKVDFGILHLYPTPVWGEKLKQMNPIEIFSLSLSIPPLGYENLFVDTLKLTKKITGKELPFAITEYNGGFASDNTMHYLQTLGTALINAELLRIFMKPEHKVLLATYFHYSNENGGIIRAEDNFIKHDYLKPIKYVKRPSYYVYELYNKYFGTTLIDVNVRTDFYDIREGGIYPHISDVILNLKKGVVVSEDLLDIKWEIINYPGVSTRVKDGILEIDYKVIHYAYAFKKAKIKPNTYYRLSGYVKTEELFDKEGICLEVQDARGWKYLDIKTEKITGTVDWTFVHSIFRTPPEADSVIVLARRMGKGDPDEGKVFIKDVKLEEFDPDTLVPFLSVNASKSKNGDKIYLMVINKNLEKAISCQVQLSGFVASEKARIRVLNGPSITATNEIIKDNVNVVYKEIEIVNGVLKMNFDPHTLTAIEIEKRKL
ncbi:MAG: hypothetical protein C4526_02040 [Nitrospiraceae bacterium]|nr:MAG: hypothetical protein C4526_02040 [Nitrospiraceae bacterium]